MVKRKQGVCPVCQREAVKGYHPFCSKVCADKDLEKWLGGNYRFQGRDGEAVENVISSKKNTDIA